MIKKLIILGTVFVCFFCVTQKLEARGHVHFDIGIYAPMVQQPQPVVVYQQPVIVKKQPCVVYRQPYYYNQGYYYEEVIIYNQPYCPHYRW